MKTEFKKAAIKKQVAINLLQIIARTKKNMDANIIERLKGMAGSNARCNCKIL